MTFVLIIFKQCLFDIIFKVKVLDRLLKRFIIAVRILRIVILTVKLMIIRIEMAIF